jgi:hypothetical protein
VNKKHDPGHLHFVVESSCQNAGYLHFGIEQGLVQTGVIAVQIRFKPTAVGDQPKSDILLMRYRVHCLVSGMNNSMDGNKSTVVPTPSEVIKCGLHGFRQGTAAEQDNLHGPDNRTKAAVSSSFDQDAITWDKMGILPGYNENGCVAILNKK